MIRLLTLLGAIFCLIITGLGYASTSKHSVQPTINLYATPDLRARVVEKVDPTTRLVPIFRQGKWVKVGSSADGKVGWINRAQYQEAMEALYQPNFQTIFVRTERGQNGKLLTHVVAYKNGKKLSEKETDALYDQVKQEQARDAKNMERMFWDMDNILEEQGREMNDFVEPWDNVGFGFGPEIVQPVIIVNSTGHSASGSK